MRVRTSRPVLSDPSPGPFSSYVMPPPVLTGAPWQLILASHIPPRGLGPAGLPRSVACCHRTATKSGRQGRSWRLPQCLVLERAGDCRWTVPRGRGGFMRNIQNHDGQVCWTTVRPSHSDVRSRDPATPVLTGGLTPQTRPMSRAPAARYRTTAGSPCRCRSSGGTPLHRSWPRGMPDPRRDRR